MAYFSFVALMFAGVAILYAEEAKKQIKVLTIRVKQLERNQSGKL